MPTVWIANNGGHDYSPAKEYGKLRSLTVGTVNPLRVDRISDTLSQGIGRLVEKEDFLLISGSYIVNMLALHLWLEMFGECKLLQFNAKQRKYRVSHLSKEHLKEILQRGITGISQNV